MRDLSDTHNETPSIWIKWRNMCLHRIICRQWGKKDKNGRLLDFSTKMSNGKQPDMSSVCVCVWRTTCGVCYAFHVTGTHTYKKWNINSAHLCTLMTTGPFRHKMTTCVLSPLSAPPRSGQDTWGARLTWSGSGLFIFMENLSAAMAFLPLSKSCCCCRCCVL